MQRLGLSPFLCSFSIGLLAGCAVGDEEPATETTQVSTALQIGAPIGSPLPGTDPVAFAAARDNFAAAEDINDGLGPTFNGDGCGTCHGTPVLGGSGNQIERRFGRVANGTFFGFDAQPEDRGGTLRQLFSNGTYQFDGKTCSVPLDSEPATATVRNVGRRSIPLFGLGLVDAMPDAWFESLAASQPAATRGVVQRVVPPFPDPRDPSQALGVPRVARFGHKGQVPGLLTFSGDAYVNEMGISTQSCYKGTSILAFASENEPNKRAPEPGCNGGDLKPANPAGDPNIPEFTDDVVGSCADGKTEIQDDMANFLFFMERLAPPPRNITDPVSVVLGAGLFEAVGCASCHTSTAFKTPANPFNGVPGNYTFFPYSDFLGHDMGSLGDRIGNTGDSVATTRVMRTTPLWGARFNTQFLHDGRAKTLQEAILAHDGQARLARELYRLLGSSGQNLVLTFISSL
jgi:CxxC motif-containing protein (DUF1111 family)